MLEQSGERWGCRCRNRERDQRACDGEVFCDASVTGVPRADAKAAEGGGQDAVSAQWAGAEDASEQQRLQRFASDCSGACDH